MPSYLMRSRRRIHTIRIFSYYLLPKISDSVCNGNKSIQTLVYQIPPSSLRPLRQAVVDSCASL